MLGETDSFVALGAAFEVVTRATLISEVLSLNYPPSLSRFFYEYLNIISDSFRVAGFHHIGPIQMLSAVPIGGVSR